MLTICDIIPELKKRKHSYKLHFAMVPSNKMDAFNSFLENRFKQWQENQSRKNFERKFILSLIYLGPSEWMFAGVYLRISYKKVKDRILYKTVRLDIGDDLIGRLIIKYKKTVRAAYPKFEKHYKQLIVSEIRKTTITSTPFPDYESLNINYSYLKTLVVNNDSVWKSALQSVKGVYLITDKLTGKHYVGSAYGNEAIWQRWSNYVKTGHSGNKKLKLLLKTKGKEYLKNFYFSILEIAAKSKDDEYIIKRESHWKNMLLTRGEFGYNDN